MKFLHAADLHLGCMPNNSPLRFGDFFSRLEELCDVALDQNVDAVLVAGDFFHHRSIDANTLHLAVQQLQRLSQKGIPLVAVEGNHDKAFYASRRSWLEYLNSTGLIRLLKPVYTDAQPRLTDYDGEKGAVWEYKGVRFVGMGFLGGATRERLAVLAQDLPCSDLFTVALLHTGVDRLMGLDMGAATGEDLQAFRGKVDYFALGHVHIAYQVQDWAFNPGAPESVSLREGGRGEKGYYLVTVTDKSFTATFLPSNRRALLECTLDVSRMSTEILLEQALASCSQVRPGHMLRLILQGQAQGMVDVSLLQRKLTETYDLAVCEVEDMTYVKDHDAEVAEAAGQSDVERAVLQAMAKEQGLPPQAGQAALALCDALLQDLEPQSLYEMLLTQVREWEDRHAD